jgi:dipeptidyl aminopeptidase/acylaminoacyl peptidase
VRFAKSSDPKKMTKSAAHNIEKIQTGILILHGVGQYRPKISHHNQLS